MNKIFNKFFNFKDVNDNMPVFERPDYVFRIPATTNNYQVIGRVIATDDDITGPNSQVKYRIFRRARQPHVSRLLVLWKSNLYTI